MQAANHFYKVLDEKTIIVVPDNPQARRDYEDLVIRTFYLSNGDAEQVTNVVRTMIEARNVFPLKALNAITIRDTADKVRIAEKIIEANDKAKAEVVVAGGARAARPQPASATSAWPSPASRAADGRQLAPPTADGRRQRRDAFTGGTLNEIASVVGSLNDLAQQRDLHHSDGDVLAAQDARQQRAARESGAAHLRGREGHAAHRPAHPRSGDDLLRLQHRHHRRSGGTNLAAPYTSFQYQDVGIKVAMEPRVHHNREVTLKLTVEVSNRGEPVDVRRPGAADVRHAHDRVDDPPQGRRDELPGRPHSAATRSTATRRRRSSATCRSSAASSRNEQHGRARAPTSC